MKIKNIILSNYHLLKRGILYKPHLWKGGFWILFAKILLYGLQGNETFFANQIEAITEGFTIPKSGLIYGKYLFEIGRKRKSFEQIADIDNSYLAVDNIEIGIGNRIPLWIFGFLY